MNETPAPPPPLPVNPPEKKSKAKGCLKGCLGTMGVLIALLMIMTVIGMITTSRDNKKKDEFIGTFMETLESGENAEAYKMLQEKFRKTFSPEDLDALLTSVRFQDANGWKKEFYNRIEDDAVYEFKFDVDGAPDLAFYMFLGESEEKIYITKLTTEAPPKMEASFTSTTTFTTQTMKSPLQEIYVSDDPEDLTGYVTDSWDKKAGLHDIYGRIDFRKAPLGASLKISWVADVMGEWGIERIELGPIEGKLDVSTGYIPFSVNSGTEPFPPGKHRIEVYLGDKRLGTKEWSLTE